MRSCVCVCVIATFSKRAEYSKLLVTMRMQLFTITRFDVLLRVALPARHYTFARYRQNSTINVNPSSREDPSGVYMHRSLRNLSYKLKARPRNNVNVQRADAG